MTTATKADTLERLLAMSRELGRPELDYAILGEGNTSARIDDATFFVKASGSELRTLDANGVVEVSLAAALALLDAAEIRDCCGAAVHFKVEADAGETEAVRILAEPFGGRRADVGGVLHGAPGGVVWLEGLFEAVAGWIRERMPAPLGERGEGDGFAVEGGEGLETGDVGGESELAVADAERRPGIGGADDGVVAADESLPVDGLS